MTIDSDVTRLLRTAFATLYADTASTRRVAEDAGLNTSLVEFGGSAINNWQAILREAINQGRLDKLLAIARSEYATNPHLAQAYAAYQSSKAAAPASTSSPATGASGGKYNIQIGTAQGTVIGDGVQVTQNFGPISTPGPNAPANQPKMRILFLAANPIDTDHLRLGEEVRAIDERLRSAEHRVFELVSHWAVRASDLSDFLLRYQPHIVHFSGHGSAAGNIILENHLGQAEPVPPQALTRLFRILKDNIRCVVLNACLSAEQAAAIAQEIDCVVGMTKEIGDDAAIRFASGFYRALGYGRTVLTAYELGCNEIGLFDLTDETTSVLFTKPGVDADRVTFI